MENFPHNVTVITSDSAASSDTLVCYRWKGNFSVLMCLGSLLIMRTQINNNNDSNNNNSNSYDNVFCIQGYSIWCNTVAAINRSPVFNGDKKFQILEFTIKQLLWNCLIEYIAIFYWKSYTFDMSSYCVMKMLLDARHFFVFIYIRAHFLLKAYSPHVDGIRKTMPRTTISTYINTYHMKFNRVNTSSPNCIPPIISRHTFPCIFSLSFLARPLV